MKPDVKKIIADIKATKGNRKYCNGLAGTLQDDNYASSICKYVKTVTPERIDLLIEYTENLEAEVTDMAVQLANAESKCRELAAENAGLNKFITQSCYVFDGEQHEISDAYICATDGGMPETQTTDAFLNDVLVKSRKEGAYFVANRMLAAWDAGFIDDTAKNAADIARMILTSTEFMAAAPEGDFDRSFADGVLEDIAAQIRKGAAL
ncbi:ead/Ea22-like family protein [Citrobacter portucalensis]